MALKTAEDEDKATGDSKQESYITGKSVHVGLFR